RFPPIAGATELMAQSVTTVVLKRMQGKARWSANRNLSQQVLAAAQEANAEKALGLLRARYRITHEAVLNDAFSKQVDEFLKSGMVEVEEMKMVRLYGSRTVTLEQTRTLRVKPSLASTLVSGVGVLNFGMVYFNLINLNSALKEVQSDGSFEAAAGFISAILGTMGAVAAALVSTRAIYATTMLRLTGTAPGLAYSGGVARFLTSKLFSRGVGWPVIVFGLSSDLSKAKRQYRQGDSASSAYTASGGFLVAAGSFAILEGSLAITGATFFVPVAGWAAAAIVLLGAAIVAGGLALHAQAHASKHTPIELWAARSIFGNYQNDGEHRPTITLDTHKRLPKFYNLNEEIRVWYAAYYAPVLLNKDEAKSLGWEGVDSKLHNHRVSNLPSWERIFPTGAPREQSKVEFTILLRGYLLSQSSWEGNLSSIEGVSDVKVVLPVTPAIRLTSAGLLLNVTKEISGFDNWVLNIAYSPNQGLDESAVATAHLLLED
ncbi:hypothetical protein GUY40_21810, partial [Pseudomonas sp. R5(2019)]|nr:hypothetical protein [Pseudomonas sp. R5(2019)]